jgi:hypothetical protein
VVDLRLAVGSMQWNAWQGLIAGNVGLQEREGGEEGKEPSIYVVRIVILGIVILMVLVVFLVVLLCCGVVP